MNNPSFSTASHDTIHCQRALGLSDKLRDWIHRGEKHSYAPRWSDDSAEDMMFGIEDLIELMEQEEQEPEHATEDDTYCGDFTREDYADMKRQLTALRDHAKQYSIDYIQVAP